MAVFFVMPFLYSLYYVFTDIDGAFTGVGNFTSTLGSKAFTTALKNTGVFLGICVPLNVVASFFIASVLRKARRKNALSLMFMLPLVIPSGAVVFFWRVLFDETGFINKLILAAGGAPVIWLQSNWALMVVILAFLVKNIGFNVVLFMAGFSAIPRDYYEIALIEGANRFQTFRTVTYVYMSPTTFLVFLMSIINSFKIFKEIYLLFGNYPFQSIYMLQHYMNNQFAAANMQKLSTAATMLSVIIGLIVLVFFRMQKKVSDTFS